jgi:hypothetical protein
VHDGEKVKLNNCIHYCFLLYRSGICTALIIVPRLDLHGSIIIYMMVRKSKLNNIINYTDGILAIEQHNSVHVYNNTGILIRYLYYRWYRGVSIVSRTLFKFDK